MRTRRGSATAIRSVFVPGGGRPCQGWGTRRRLASGERAASAAVRATSLVASAACSRCGRLASRACSKRGRPASMACSSLGLAALAAPVTAAAILAPLATCLVRLLARRSSKRPTAAPASAAATHGLHGRALVFIGRLDRAARGLGDRHTGTNCSAEDRKCQHLAHALTVPPKRVRKLGARKQRASGGFPSPASRPSAPAWGSRDRGRQSGR